MDLFTTILVTALITCAVEKSFDAFLFWIMKMLKNNDDKTDKNNRDKF